MKIQWKSKRENVHIIFPIIALLELYVAIENRVLLRSGSEPNEAFPLSILHLPNIAIIIRRKK